MSTSPTEPVTTLEEGRNYYIQSCTKDWIGRLVRIDGPYTVVLADAYWVSDSGRLHQFLRDGRSERMELERVGVVGVQWVNWIPWTHGLDYGEAV